MFLQFSPVRAKKKPKAVEKEKESEQAETLSFAPFTHNPKLFFEDVKVGETVSRKLIINNPTTQDVDILLSHNIPDDLNVSFNWIEATIIKNSNEILEVTWCPLKEICARYIISVDDGKLIRRDVPVAFKSVLPKRSKTGTRPKNKPETVVYKQKSPVKKASPIRKTSPTKKYYSARPPNISPKRYSSSQKKYSPTFKKFSPSPTKKSLMVFSVCSPSPKTHTTRTSQVTKIKSVSTYEIPSTLVNVSADSNMFVSPASATFHLDYVQPIRRDTYIVSGKENSPTESNFSDSLEGTSPDVSPHISNQKDTQRLNVDYSKNVYSNKLPLGISNRENTFQNVYEHLQENSSETGLECGFEYKLIQSESICFTPLATPDKLNGNFSPTFSSSTEKCFRGRKASETIEVMELFPEKNKTFEVLQASPNISTETYVKSNLSSETYVKGNASFETYVKGNVSGGTYTKDSSIGDVANLSLSPISVSPGVCNVSQPSITRDFSLSGDSARNVIEANLWSGINRRFLSSIQEESYVQQSIIEADNTTQSFLKRKSTFDIAPTPTKKPNITRTPRDWAKKGGTAFRIAKKSTGLNLKQFFNNNNSVEANKDINAVLSTKDTNTIIIQNPFLFANLADPFMTPHLYINEEWMDQQEIDFKKWLNALLTPPEHLNFEEQTIDVAKVWQECKRREIEAAPTKETVSNKYHTNSKLNSLRKSAQTLFRSKEMSTVLSKVVMAVDTGKLAIRADKDVHLNLMLKSEVMSMLLSYNPLWLRIGLETIYNEIIPLRSNSDVMGLSTFIATRFLRDPYLLKKYKAVHSPKYVFEFKKFFLKKFLILVYFLDQAKNKKLILHDPCLFCKKGEVKESREMLIRLAREMLAAIGDVNKYLRHLDYVVTHAQTYIHEFDYAVNNLGVDLRDGVRLTKVMEIILLQSNLTATLRVPAISRLQKIHNMKIVFDALEKAGYKILYDIKPKDIVDGHKEKTLSFLWQIIYKFQAPLMVKSVTTIQAWFRSLPVVLKRRKLERERLKREQAAAKIQAWYRRQKLAKKLFKFTSFLRIYVETVRRERAAIKIQSYYRMHRCRSTYIMQYMIVLNIQRLSRGWLVRNVYKERIKKAVVIQRNVRMYLARKKYLALKNSVSVIQARYRARRLMKSDHSAYMELKTITVYVQRRFRAIQSAVKERNAYLELKSATICLQQRFRANRLCRQERYRYIEMRLATVRIQSWYRSIIAMRICRKRYILLKKSVVIIEEHYITLRVMQIERNNYQILKRSCITIQRQYRAYTEMKIKRKEYLKLKASTVYLQRSYRANKLMQKQKRYYETLRLATMFIQRKFRANRAMKLARNKYLAVRNATVTIQIWFRATVEMRRCHEYYRSLKYAVHIFEDRYEAKKLMQAQRSGYQQLKSIAITIQRRYRALLAMRQCKAEYTRLKATVILVQSRFRANKMAVVQRQQYLELKQASLVIQNRYRAQKCMEKTRREYVELRRVTVIVQRRFRANVLMKKARSDYENLLISILNIQRRLRGNRAMLEEKENYQKLRKAAILIQRRWRAKKLGKIQRQEFGELKNTALFIQRRWRANKLAQRERTKYENLKKTALFVQAKWRAKKDGGKVRKDYMQLKNAVGVVQERWKAKKLGEYHRERYKALRNATTTIQRRWKANKITAVERTRYQELKRVAAVVQSRWRAKLLTARQRQYYLELRRVTVFVQQKWRAKKIGKQFLMEYEELKQVTICIQRRWRANKMASIERTKYEYLKRTVIICQQRWRARRLAVRDRKKYLELRNTTVFVQQIWRAKKLGKVQIQSYRALIQATLYVQRRWRANKLATIQRSKYQSLKNAAVTVQKRWRAKKLAENERNNYLQLRKAAVAIQRRWRAKKIGEQQLERYKALRRAAVYIQTHWKANKTAVIERTKFETLRKAVVVVENRWRAKILADKERQNYLQLKSVAIIIQQRWRANKLTLEQRKRYTKLRKATIFVQRLWRANKLAKQEFSKYQTMRLSCIIIQSTWRGTRRRKDYLQLRNAIIVLQQRWRAKKLCRQQVERYELTKKTVLFVQRKWRANILARQQREKYEALRKAAITIQTKWRAIKIAETERHSFLQLKNATVVLQRRWRAKKVGEKQLQIFIKVKSSTIFIQRYYRGYLKMKQDRQQFEAKRKAIGDLQRRIRGYLVRRKYADYFTPEAREKRKIEKIEKEAATQIQAYWRGYRSRSSSLNTSALLKIRQRAIKANVKAEPQNTLASRCSVALQTLISEKLTVSMINKLLEDLDFITRHSHEVCDQVGQFLPEQMYLMIKTTNRSLPEMTVCIFSVHILVNLYKYAPSRPYTFISGYIDDIITVMLHWCDKDAQLFPSMCTLLWLFAHTPKWKRSIKSVPNIQQRFSKIQAQVARKDVMVKRAGIKGHSVFAGYKNLPLPSCDPDWGLEYKHNPRVFTNAVHAFSSLLNILEM